MKFSIGDFFFVKYVRKFGMPRKQIIFREIKMMKFCPCLRNFAKISIFPIQNYDKNCLKEQRIKKFCQKFINLAENALKNNF